MKDYASPIEMITNSIIKSNEEQLEDSMLFSVEREIGFKVDKEELIKALEYDRKQYEKGFEDGLKSVLDDIKDEFISLYPKNYAGEPELGGCSCLFSLNQILQIIDKYKSQESEVQNDR